MEMIMSQREWWRHRSKAITFRLIVVINEIDLRRFCLQEVAGPRLLEVWELDDVLDRIEAVRDSHLHNQLAHSRHSTETVSFPKSHRHRLIDPDRILMSDHILFLLRRYSVLVPKERSQTTILHLMFSSTRPKEFCMYSVSIKSLRGFEKLWRSNKLI
jgi:hypothetical protein